MSVKIRRSDAGVVFNVIAGLLLPASALLAQPGAEDDVDPAAQQDTVPDPVQASSVPPSARRAAGGIEEVVVTATRRAERLQDVPIAVTAVSGEEVEARQIANFVDAVQLAPGPTFIPVKGTSVISVQIRGRTSTNDATSLGSPVGVFIDDIYYGSLASFDADFFDVEQIAILRGPQGTTFGRNVVGGGLQITSRRAELGLYEGRFSLTGQSIDDHPGFGAQGSVNLPFGDDLAARFAFSTKDHEGYQHNLVTGSDLADNRIWSLRGGLTYAATDSLEISSLISYSRRNNLGDGPAIFGDGALAAQQQAADPDLHEIFVDVDGRTTRSIFSAMLRADWDMALGTLSSITGYRTLNAELDEDADGSQYALNAPSLNTNDEWQFSQEFRLTSTPGERFDYIAGLYYGFENLNHAIVFNFDGTIPESFLSVLLQGAQQSQTVVGEAHTLSLGPYFEGTWHVTETVDATAGLRYVYEDKTGYTEHIGSSVFYGGPYLAELEESWSEWTPRVILEYKPSPELLFYASASKGFQSGGWTLTARTPEAAQTPLEPEKTWSYELGTKSSWFGGRLTTNVAVYQAVTEDLQVRSLVNGVLNDTNAGEAEVKGIEVELAANPLDGLVVGVNYAYTDAKYSSYDGCATRANPDAGQEGQPPTLPVSCTGNALPFTPEHDTSLYVTYDWLLAGGDVLSLRVDDKISSKYELSPTRGQQSVVPLTERTSIVNASLTWAAADERWSAQLWGRNLTDELIVTNGLAYSFYLLSPAEVQALGGLANADAARVQVGPPRTLGVTLTFQFK